MDHEFSEESLAAIGRMLRHLPEQKDLTLIVLKGHLLLERAMMDVARKHAAAGEVQKIEGLKFFPLTRVTRALVEHDTLFEDQWDEDWWDAIDLLNKLRNQLAHRLEPAEATELAKQFVKLVGVESLDWTAGGVERIAGTERSLEAECKACVAILCSALSAFA